MPQYIYVVKDDNIASFRFTITKVNDGSSLDVVLEGIEGTMWGKLSFRNRIGSQLIDNRGLNDMR